MVGMVRDWKKNAPQEARHLKKIHGIRVGWLRRKDTDNLPGFAIPLKLHDSV
jgi:hypothetical protein